MNSTSTAIETPTTVLTTASGSLTAITAPSAEVNAVMIASGTSSLQRSRRARAKRAVAEIVMKVTANMLVATAWRGDIPTTIISGTLISELPPVMAPIAPVIRIKTERIAIWVALSCMAVGVSKDSRWRRLGRLQNTSDRDGLAILARVAAAAVGVAQALDDLRAAEDHRRWARQQLVPARRQRRRDLGREPLLQRDLRALGDVPAGRVAGRLRVLPVPVEAQHHLHVPLRLHVPTHHPEGARRLAAAGDEARHDGVERPLAARDAVGVTPVSY